MKNQTLKNFEITLEFEGSRLDNFLSKNTEFTRNQIQNIIKKGDVLCNSKKVKASYVLKEADNVTLDLENTKIKELNLFHNTSLNVDIVFEDDDIIVVNKEAGLVTHPGAGFETESLVHALYDKLPKESEDPTRPGVVHRLDKDTQGLLVLAKNIESQADLAAQFKDKSAGRTYQALCYGKYKKNNGTYKSNLKRDPRNRKKYKSQETGKLAITHYKLLNESEISFVELKLETGRTHQIRVHLSEDNHPILNDKAYGNEKRLKEIKDIKLMAFIKGLKNMPLVATKLKFFHPKTKEELSFEIPWPKEFSHEDLSN